MDSSEGVGSPLPSVHGHDLERAEVSLPSHAHGKVALVVFAFARAAQAQIATWITPFERELCPIKGFTYYEVPMISGMWGRMFSGMIDAGMRAGIPPEQHRHVVTYYGDFSTYASLLAMDDPSLCYPFLLDTEGIVRWRSQGFATPDGLADMLRLAKTLQEGG